MCFDCCGGAHLDLCSIAVSLRSTLYSPGLTDYSLTEQSGKHVNNLVGLDSACSLWHTQEPTQYSIVCCAWVKTTGGHVRRNHMLSLRQKHTQTHTHTHTHTNTHSTCPKPQTQKGGCARRRRKPQVYSPTELQAVTLAGPDTERHPVLWIQGQPPHYTYTQAQHINSLRYRSKGP